MCEGNSLEMENARFFFKDIENRNNTMLTIMHQYTNYVIASLAIVWGLVAGNLGNLGNLNYWINWAILIAINISILVLIAWRYYVHYLDNAIAKNYLRLICYEDFLLGFHSTLRKYSILCGLIEKWPVEEKQILNKTINEKYLTFKKLFENKRLGYRGQYWFNVVTIVLVIFLLAFEAFLLQNFQFSIKSLLFVFGLCFMAISLLIAFYCETKNCIHLLSKNNKIQLKNAFIVIIILSGIPLVFSIFINYQIFSSVPRLYLILIKDLFYFMVISHLICCYVQHDPTLKDIQEAINKASVSQAAGT